MHRKLAIALLTLGMLGCSQTPTPGTTSTSVAVVSATPAVAPPPAAASLPEGWSKVTSNDGKLKIALPAEWTVVDPNNKKFTDFMDELAKNNPSMPKIDGKGFYFMAMSTKPQKNFSDNVNVVKQPGVQTIPFTKESADALKGELTKVLPLEGGLDIKVVELPHGSAFRYETGLKMKTPGGETRTHAVGFMLFHGTDLYTFTFSTRPDNKDSFGDVADQAMQRFELTP